MDSPHSRPYRYAAKYSIAVVTLTFTAAIVLFFLRCHCHCCKLDDHSETQSVKSHHIKHKKFTPGISLEHFILYFLVVFVLVVGSGLLSVTIWSCWRKIFVYSLFMEVKLDSMFFSIPAGLLCIPTILLTIMLKSNKLNYLLMLTTILVIAIALLSIGYVVGTVYVLAFSNETMRLESTIPKAPLNDTLYNLLADYEKSHEKNKTALNQIHSRFKCCGIDSRYDFVDVPISCCPKGDCKRFKVWPMGCLRSIQEDVAWHKHATLSITQLFVLMYFFNITMVLTVFVSDYSKRRDVRSRIKTNERQSR